MLSVGIAIVAIDGAGRAPLLPVPPLEAATYDLHALLVLIARYGFLQVMTKGDEEWEITLLRRTAFMLPLAYNMARPTTRTLIKGGWTGLRDNRNRRGSAVRPLTLARRMTHVPNIKDMTGGNHDRLYHDIPPPAGLNVRRRSPQRLHGDPIRSGSKEAVLASAADATTNGGGDAADALREASSHGVQYKVDGDPRSALTEADGAAQEVILHCLRHRWGADLHIVGEEDEDGSDGNTGQEKQDVFERYGVPRPEDAAINEDILSTDPAQDVPLSSVTLYVDPMDGTREFVEGRLGNVQCLVGIVVDGKPVGGVVGLPFAGGRTETQEGKKGVIFPIFRLYMLC